MAIAMNADVLVIGDGPAGAALAQACVRRGLEVLLIGDDVEWTNTYGVWVDDLARCTLLADVDRVIATRSDDVVVHTDRRHRLGRPYGLVDNRALADVLFDGVRRHVGRVVDVDVSGDGVVARLSDATSVSGHLAVDATGWPARFAIETSSGSEPAWQTAFGVVLAAAPEGDLGRPTVMDFRPVDDDPLVTFAYSLPVADGWLVEETVLAARPAVDPDRLRSRLARRLAIDVAELDAGSRRIETVRIPMGGPVPSRSQPIAAFGAAAGGIHPISGYSIAASIHDAPGVAAVIDGSLDDRRSRPHDHAAAVWDAVWSIQRRRARILHEYGLDLLTRMDGATTRSFFGTFFDLPVDTWSAFMRGDTPPGQLARTMSTMFRTAPLPVKRALVGGNPLDFTRLVRPR